MCRSSLSNVIYHKFSHGAAFYTLSGKNVKVMLESKLISIAYVKEGIEKVQKLGVGSWDCIKFF